MYLALDGQNLVEIHTCEIAQTPLGDDLVGGRGCNEVLVAREGRAARAHGPEQDLVLLEGRWLEHDPHAVG